MTIDQPIQGSQSEHIGPIVEQILQGVIDQMSTYVDGSELSRFNAQSDTDWFAVSSDLATVVEVALELGAKTHGAFDVTVGPLVNLWGFGADGPRNDAPSPLEVNKYKRSIGYQHLAVDRPGNRLRKHIPQLYVDLSGIAKGFAVDKVAERLGALGVRDFMVEIGGEVRAGGVNRDGRPWRIAIQSPRGPGLKHIIGLTELGLATSGDYRNQFQADGRTYSHTIDPRTGAPISGGLISASVLHTSAMYADAFATALMTMPPDVAYRFAQRQGLSVYLIDRTENGLRENMTPGFKRLIVH